MPRLPAAAAVRSKDSKDSSRLQGNNAMKSRTAKRTQKPHKKLSTYHVTYLQGNDVLKQEILAESVNYLGNDDNILVFKQRDKIVAVFREWTGWAIKDALPKTKAA
jgi:hypothetical protein